MCDCNCGHCHNDDDANGLSSEEKIEKLKEDIAEIGFDVEETEEGIKITEK